VVVIAAAALFIWYFYLRPSPSKEEVASLEKMALPLPEKPSIAVLPFDNMSADPGQEYFSDGITESVITTLSKIPDLFVIARNSTFVYKGQPVKIQQVAEDLGVRYVLEGSVQRTADRVRVTAQLIDAATGTHMWAERYNSDLSDIFRIQDEITIEITRQLRVELIEGDQVRLRAKQDTENLEAYEKALQGRAYSFRGTKDDNVLARQLYEDAIALDPEFVSAYASLGWTHFWDARFGWSESKERSLEEAFTFAQKANSLDDTLDDSHLLLAAVYLLRREWEGAVVEAERAVALNPNGADAYSVLAGIVSCVGRWEDGIVYAKKSIRLNPFPPVYYYHWLGRAYFMTGQYDEAIKTWNKVLQINPDYVPAHSFLAATYSTMNRNEDASDKIAEVLRIDPKFCIESYAQTLPYKSQSDIDRYVQALRKAGLPEKLPANK
jgi:adenylate cyclase